MSNKLKITRNKMIRLGIKKTQEGDYENIDPRERDQSKYKPTSCINDLINTVEGEYKIMICDKGSTKVADNKNKL